MSILICHVKFFNLNLKETIMTEYRITCINKTPRDNRHESINTFGGLNPNGSTWGPISLTALIAWMKNNPTSSFYTLSNNLKAYVKIIPATILIREHLRTVADGKPTNNLLDLPECVS